MGMLAYSTLSPVVVAYAFLIAGTGGLLPAGVVPMAQDSPGGLAEQILILNRVLRGGITAFAMRGIIFVASVPPLVASLGIRAIREPVYRAIRG